MRLRHQLHRPLEVREARHGSLTPDSKELLVLPPAHLVKERSLIDSLAGIAPCFDAVHGCMVIGPAPLPQGLE